MNIQILRVNKKGEILEGKIFSFDKFDHGKFEVLSTYIRENYKKINPAFVFSLDLKLQDAIQVLRGVVEGYVYPDYQLTDGSYYFRSGNLVICSNNEEV